MRSLFGILALLLVSGGCDDVGPGVDADLEDAATDADAMLNDSDPGMDADATLGDGDAALDADATLNDGEAPDAGDAVAPMPDADLTPIDTTTPVDCEGRTTNLGSAVGLSITTFEFRSRDAPAPRGRDDFDIACADIACGAADVGFVWTAPADGTYHFEVEQIGTSVPDGQRVVLRNGSCEGSLLSCEGYGSARASVLRGEQVIIVVTDTTPILGTCDQDFVVPYHLHILADVPLTEVGLCSDGLNNDRDSYTDCYDMDCFDSPDCFGGTACPDVDLMSATGRVDMGNIVAHGNDQRNEVCFRHPHRVASRVANDRSYHWVAPRTADYDFRLVTDAPAALYTYRGATCSGGDAPRCGASGDMGAEFRRRYTAGEEIVLIADIIPGGSGDYSLYIEDAAVSCPDSDLGSSVGMPAFSGRVLPVNHLVGCGSLVDDTHTDLTLAWRAPCTATYTFNLRDPTGDFSLAVQRGPTCTGTRLGCGDTQSYALTAGDDLILLVQDLRGSTGLVLVDITGPTGACP